MNTNNKSIFLPSIILLGLLSWHCPTVASTTNAECRVSSTQYFPRIRLQCGFSKKEIVSTVTNDFLVDCPLIAGDIVNVDVSDRTNETTIRSRASGGGWCDKTYQPGYYSGPCSVERDGKMTDTVRTLFYQGDRIVASIIPGSCEPAHLLPGIYRIISVQSISVSGQPSRIILQEAGLRLEGQSMVGDVSGFLSEAADGNDPADITGSASPEPRESGAPIADRQLPGDSVIAMPVQPTATQPTQVNREDGILNQEDPLADVVQGTIVMDPVEPTAEIVNQDDSSTTDSVGKRYRVTVNGIEAFSATNHESGDGKGDEVFIRARVFRVKKNGTVTMDRVTQSLVMGSVKNHPQRVKAGTASEHGGLKDKDRFPADMGVTGDVLNDPDGRMVPPMVVWENPLDDEQEAVLILFSIWEWDDNDKTSAGDKWDSWVNNYLVSYIERFPEKFLNAPAPRFGASNIRLLSASKYQEENLGNYGFNPIDYEKSDVSQTRPLGMRCDGKASEMYLYPNILVLNKRTGLSPGQAQMYRTSEDDFCMSGPTGFRWTLMSTYYIFAEVERLN